MEKKPLDIGEIIQTIDLMIPDVGQTGEIELLKWNIPVGGLFKAGDEICDLITDKAAFSLEAPVEGVLLSQLSKDGSIVKSGQIVGQAHIN